MAEMKNQVPFSQPTSPAGSDMTRQAKEVGTNVAAHTKEVLGEQLARRADQSADQLNDVANALRKTSADLEGKPAARYMEKAADQVDRISHYLRDANIRDVRKNVESFARREPLLYLGGAFAIGLLGARFLKSSASHNEADTP